MSVKGVIIMDRFTVEILPVVVRFAALSFRCPDLESLTLTFAWYCWMRATPEKQQELPASVWARLGVRWVKSKRDIPGVMASMKDAMHRAQQGGAMEGLADRYPGPEQIVMDRERYATVKSRATDRERILIEMFEDHRKLIDVAAKLEVSPGRITQIRQGLIDLDE